MYPGRSLLAVLCLAVAAFASDQTQGLILLPCGQGSSINDSCTPSRQELKDAKEAFTKGLKLEHGNRLDEALDQFEKATHLAPRDVEYVTALETLRQQLVYDHLKRGNDAQLAGRQVEALGEFRSALHLDPRNEFAQARLNDALAEWAPKVGSQPRIVAASGVTRLEPDQVRADFHYRGESRALLTQIASAFGVKITLDDSVTSRQVDFNIDQVDFYTAMRAACEMTHTFWTALDAKQILVAADTTENHRQFDRMAMRTFYIPSVNSPQDLNDLTNLLRTVFEIKFVAQQAPTGTIVVRAPEDTLDAATRFVESLDDARPEVMLDVRLYEVSHSLTRNLGLHIPNNFTLFNIPAGALAALGGQSIQDLINQLISGGGINQATGQGLSGLLAQLQGQQNSIFSQPLATFGGGLTFMGLSLDQASAQLSLNESWIRTLEHSTVRVAQGNEATLHVGSRYPILNASFSPVFNSSAISQVIQNGSFQAPFPSFSYEDLGLTIKVKPVIHSNSDVGLQLELQFRVLTGASVNSVPVIGNREYKGSITLRDSEPAVVAGAVSQTDQRSLNGIPGLGAVPLLNQVMASNSVEHDEDEILIMITPRVTREANQISTEVWLPH
ncbi:MAG TPA: hypothetical protein VLW84_03610 [Terriglobales bacterium]|nr:hypothetical protein [Terriglobales bacterium]